MERERLKRHVPALRGCAQRRERLLAARTYAVGSAPRFGILLGHWDSGTAIHVRAAMYETESIKRKERPDGHEA